MKTANLAFYNLITEITKKIVQKVHTENKRNINYFEFLYDAEDALFINYSSIHKLISSTK